MSLTSLLAVGAGVVVFLAASGVRFARWRQALPVVGFGEQDAASSVTEAFELSERAGRRKAVERFVEKIESAHADEYESRLKTLFSGGDKSATKKTN